MLKRCDICKKIIRNLDKRCMRDLCFSLSGVSLTLVACQSCSKDHDDCFDKLRSIGDLKVCLLDGQMSYDEYVNEMKILRKEWEVIK